ncbi:MAG: bifunctional acetate--CoA ligase family protein/GNAT family N-acetyltransferase [Dehalococcoidales bacterium]|nr:bifunctional acetate--CoA ligase family protein/GNAT family N-acetyltransferase [Dehalococcoidales bacterium]
MDNIKTLFAPKSVAVVGATDRKGSVGRTVFENLLAGKDQRHIYPINPKRETLLEEKCYPDIASIPEIPDLVVIATSAVQVPQIIKEACTKGTKNAVIISSGFKEAGEEGIAREQEILKTAKAHGMRIIGPNCLGILRPGSNLNATFANRSAKSGGIAFLSQSGALGTAVLDWAVKRDIGFSMFASLGSMLDIDFGDLIDMLGEDPETKSIIIYLESIGTSIASARKFMSAARGFARSKPIIVIKPGRYAESAKAAQSHTGAMVGEDFYYKAALDRAGTVRVEEIEELFNCASILNTSKLPKHSNVAIITNAGGPAVLATDSLISHEGKLSDLSDDTMKKLNELLPAFWSKSNPIDILGDADEKRYTDTIDTVLKDPQVNGAIIIYTPQGAASPERLAKGIIASSKKSSKPVLAVMIGTEDVDKARQILHNNSIPTYDFPEKAVKTYMYMRQYSRHLEELYEEPEDTPLNMGAPKNYLKILTRNAIGSGNLMLNEDDSKKLLSTYGIESTTTRFARNGDEARMVAVAVGFPVVMKIESPDISHKSDVGGVILNLKTEKEVTQAYDKMIASVKKAAPNAVIKGVTLQRMITDYDYELIIGSKKDPILGPVILFGLGGTEAEFVKDIAVGLPPLNLNLARRVIERTRIYSILSKGFRTRPPANLSLLDEMLVKVSDMIIDFPEIQELDINPLVMSGDNAIALDARILLDGGVTPTGNYDYSHLMISPYPTKYIQPWICNDGREVILRPIRPEDEDLEKELIANLSPESSRYRFFQVIKDISHDMLSRFCNIDYDREMAIIAEYSQNGKRRNVGVGRLIMEFGGDTAEFAVLVADDFQGRGLGIKLLDVIIGIAQEKGLKSLYGIAINDNWRIIGLTRKMGFTNKKISEDETLMTLELR